MNVRALEQGIVKHIEEVYRLFRQDASRITERETLIQLCELDSQKMYNYALAVKKQLIREADKLPVNGLDRKERLLSELNGMELRVPPFMLSEGDCMEEVALESAESAAPKPDAKRGGKSLANVGLPIGAIAGLGLCALAVKSAPIIVAGGIIGAVAGAYVGKAVAASGRTSARTPNAASPSPVRRTVLKVSQRKLEAAIQARQQTMIALFTDYLRQVERRCQSI